MAGGTARKRQAVAKHAAAVAAADAEADGEGWSSLPEDLLLTVATLILSFTELAAFSSVCRAWRAAAALSVKIAPQIRPPLLASRDKCKRYWRLHDPALPAAHSRRLNLSLRMLEKKGKRIVGVSRGRVIVDDEDQDALSVIDPLSGDTVCSPPPLPPPLGKSKSGAVIAAHFLDANTLLVVLSNSDRTGAIQWSLGAEEWTSARYGLEYYQQFAALPDDRLFALSCFQQISGRYYHQFGALPDGRLFALSRFRGMFSVRREDEEVRNSIFFDDNLPDFRRLYLVACGEILIYLHIALEVGELYVKAFRLKECTSKDLNSQEMSEAFVPLEKLGDWAIFLALQDGVPPVACRNPERWGGRSIYIAKCSYLAKLELPYEEEDEDGDEDHDGDGYGSNGEKLDDDDGSWHVVDFDNWGGWTGIELSTRKWHPEFQRSPQVMFAAPSSWDSLA